LYEAALQAGGSAARTAKTAAEGVLAAALTTRGRRPADPHTAASPPDLRTAASQPHLTAAASLPAGDGPAAHQPAGGGSLEAHRLAPAAPAAAPDRGSREAHTHSPTRPAAHA